MGRQPFSSVEGRAVSRLTRSAISIAPEALEDLYSEPQIYHFMEQDQMEGPCVTLIYYIV